ncbi:hypothetical protein AwDysgo_03560 [Bacteroidales bacterium]|nr:hypothetical protein AwDysgo_03560 [Bacteroidales bacterium]
MIQSLPLFALLFLHLLFELKGVVKISSTNLESQFVLAELDGIGSINCNPIEQLTALTKGVGSIGYLNNPKRKEVSSIGLGKVYKIEK